MINVLIFYNEKELKPIGGPTGYLYNLRDGLRKINSNEVKVSFYDAPIKTESKLKKKVKKIIPRFIMNWKSNIENVKEIKRIDKDDGMGDFDFSKYDFVHFHSTEDFYHYRNTVKKSNCKVILTSHSPQPLHQEIVDKIINLSEKKRFYFYSKIEKMDEYAFLHADYIFFPAEEALECYDKTWNKFKIIYPKIKKYIRYIPTGIISAYSNPINIYDKYKIPENSFIVSYVGRHNKIKGYDRLKKIGEYVLNNNKNIYFLIAGKEVPLTGLNSKNWIEIGWTDKPYDIIGASDIFVLPNKETYFDIALLEVMSLGKTICLTNTGGNKYFKRFNSNGLIFYEYDNIEEIGNIILDLYNKKNECIKGGRSNTKIFSDNFTSKKFAQNYYEIIASINNEKKY